MIVIDHQDCGAYAAMIDPNLSKNPERELQVHTDYLNRAYWSIRNRRPIYMNDIYPRSGHQMQNGSTVMDTQSQRDMGICCFNLTNNLLLIGKCKSFIILRSQATRPGIEDLNHLCATINLVFGVGGDRLCSPKKRDQRRKSTS